MSRQKQPPQFSTERGTRIALIFALTAQRLSDFYEHGQWLSEAQGASLAAEWLSRSSRQMHRQERQHLSALSDELARTISATLSREAGLFTAHEMTEALDPNYHSEIAQSLMTECERLLDASESEAENTADK
jgi:TPR repeat protein